MTTDEGRKDKGRKDDPQSFLQRPPLRGWPNYKLLLFNVLQRKPMKISSDQGTLKIDSIAGAFKDYIENSIKRSAMEDLNFWYL